MNAEPSANPGSDKPPLPPEPPWVLFEGQARATLHEASTEGDAVVWFAADDRSSIRVDFTSDTASAAPPLAFILPDGEPEIEPAEAVTPDFISGEPPTHVTGTKGNFGSRYWTNQRASKSKHGDTTSATWVRFHAINFSSTTVPRRELEVAGWRIVIRSLPLPEPADLSFGPTHVFDACRIDGSVITDENAEDLGSLLFDSLCFATGRVVGLAIPQRFRNQVPSFIEWSSTICDPWAGVRPWWDGRRWKSDELETLLRRWHVSTRSDDMRKLLRRLARIYASAQADAPLDVRIPVTAMGLELIAWTMLTGDEPSMTEDEFDRMSLGSCIRTALRFAGIDPAIPNEGSSLEAYSADARISDGPAAFAKVRNRLVHPPRGTNEWPTSEVMEQAWLLGLEYLALLILHLIGYDGLYWSQFGNDRWPGSEISVPWTQTPQGD